jgi:hypothetical protein
MELAAIAGMRELVNLDTKDQEGAKLILNQAAMIVTIKSNNKSVKSL